MTLHLSYPMLALCWKPMLMWYKLQNLSFVFIDAGYGLIFPHNFDHLEC